MTKWIVILASGIFVLGFVEKTSFSRQESFDKCVVTCNSSTECIAACRQANPPFPW